MWRLYTTFSLLLKRVEVQESEEVINESSFKSNPMYKENKSAKFISFIVTHHME